MLLLFMDFFYHNTRKAMRAGSERGKKVIKEKGGSEKG